MPSGPQDRRRPRQARSQALVDAILTATAELLAAEGPKRATTNRIAARAGVSVGSIYQYFPNKAALFDALGQRYVDQLHETLDATWPQLLTCPADQVVPRVLGSLLAVSTADPTLSGMLHQTSVPTVTPPPIVAFEEALAARGAELLRQRPEVFGLPGDELAFTVRILVRALGGVVGRTLAVEPELIGEPRFVRALGRLAMGFLAPGPPET